MSASREPSQERRDERQEAERKPSHHLDPVFELEPFPFGD
ncbi:MAG: hypothetical protein KatS3mg102_0904 [Planctomycetota bacterium]|nr:MAG: hypothetical protein KatS3mg102_0904 [Planctomycetota bacterium]